MMTTKKLYEIIQLQQEEINALKEEVIRIHKMSDLNDYWLREMIDALTETVDGIMDDHCYCEKYKATRGERKARELIEKQQEIKNREDA